MKRLLVVLALVLSAGLTAGAQDDRPTCAVMTFEARAGLTRDEAALLSDRFESELQRLGTFRLMSRSNMGKILEAQKFSIECSDATCAIEVGKILAIEHVVFGSIGKLGNAYTVNASLANVETAQIENSASHDMEGSVEDFLRTGMAVVARRLAGYDSSAIVLPTTEVSRRKMAVDLGGGVKMDLVWIPPGEFDMGSPESEPQRESDEGPVHHVIITKGFWMGKHEVTQGQWMQVMERNPSRFKNPGIDAPVEQVTWSDCQEFARKLSSRSQHVGVTFRLPTEAEWEYACRAGTTTPFAFGDCLSTDDANYDGNYPLTGCRKGQDRQTTVEVGSFRTNDWGLHDMHGNVWEWCADWYGDYPRGSVSDPTGPGSGSARVLRGGSWVSGAWHCRSALRDWDVPEYRGNCLGFRVVGVSR